MKITESNNVSLICEHTETVEDRGEIICKECGLVLEKAYSKGSYILGKYKHHNESTRNKHHGDVGNTLYCVGNLGTQIKVNRSYQRNPELYTRLAKRNLRSTFKSAHLELRIFKVLKKISAELNLPRHIQEGAGLRYRKLLKENKKLINNVSAICYCIWDTIRIYKYRTSLADLFDAFRKNGHNVGKKQLVRDGTLYSEYLYKHGIPQSSPKSVGDYIPYIISSMQNDEEFIKNRLEYKNIKIPPEILLTKLHGFCYKVLYFLEPQMRFFGCNPIQMAASTFYFAQILYAKIWDLKQPFTQRQVAARTNIPEYSIRDLYVNFYKQYTDLIVRIAKAQKEQGERCGS